jgi:8-oxo-dGTP pyrophosphatase MutT (NUDIX family)
MKQLQQVAVSGFILSEKDEVLMVKRSDTDDFLPGYWEAPGGGTEYGEHPLLALQREVKEETGLDIEIDGPFHVDDYFMEKHDEKIHRVEIFFACHKKDIAQEVTLSHEHSEYKWVGNEDINDVEMTDYQRKAMSAFLKRL